MVCFGPCFIQNIGATIKFVLPDQLGCTPQRRLDTAHANQPHELLLLLMLLMLLLLLMLLRTWDHSSEGCSRYCNFTNRNHTPETLWSAGCHFIFGLHNQSCVSTAQLCHFCIRILHATVDDLETRVGIEGLANHPSCTATHAFLEVDSVGHKAQIGVHH